MISEIIFGGYSHVFDLKKKRSMKILLGGMPISSKRWLLILLSKVVQS